MKRISFFLLFTSYISLNISGQSNLNDFNVTFKHNFENNTLGEYLKDEWKRDWLNPSWGIRWEDCDIIQDANNSLNPTKALQIYFPEGTVGGIDNGASWFVDFDKQDELYLSYDLMFMPGFQYQMGGKIPFLSGGVNDPGVKPNGYDGFTCGLMFKENGKITFYVYYPDSKNDTYGDSFLWGMDGYSADYFSPSHAIIEYGSGDISQCNPGEWHNLTVRMVLNTVNSSGRGNYDGILEAYFDGKLVTQVSHLLFRHTTDLGIDCLRFNTFFGGSTDEWRTPIDEWARIDNVIVYSFNDNINVLRGNVLSPTNRTINYWRNFSTVYTSAPATPGPLTSTSRTNSSISLNWTDNSTNEQGFKIYRSLSATEGFSEIATVTNNVNAYTDNSLLPGTNYYYRVRAFNTFGYSAYTAALSVTTLNLQLPAAPASFSSNAQSKTSISLEWTDNASNEQGFRIYRSLAATSGFAEIGTVSANVVAYTDNSLQPSTNYYYRIRAFNGDGYSAYTPVLSVTTLALEIPAVPEGFTAGSIEYTRCVLNWTDRSDNETGFQIERTGPDNSGTVIYHDVDPGITTFADTVLLMNSSYNYRIRSFNPDGYSAFTQPVQIKTLYTTPPSPPSLLKGTAFTDTSITVTWKDNSSNENGFVITRSLVSDSTQSVVISVDANDTLLVDHALLPSTSYIYTVKSMNYAGNSPSSNRRIATTFSVAETKRIKEGLVAYYNFGYNPDFIVYDQSGFGEPIDLQILKHSAVNWEASNKLDILSNTMLVSLVPARKITDALKSSSEISVECWIKPSEPDLLGNARLMSLATNDGQIGFVLDQDYSSTTDQNSLNFSVRLQTQSTNPSGYPAYVTDQSVSYINLHHIMYVRDKNGKEIMYVNGNKSSEGFRPSDFSTWSDDFYLRLGNENDLNHPWKGTFYSTAIYNKALSFDQVKVNYAAGPSDNLKSNDIDYKINLYPNPAVDRVILEIVPQDYQDISPETLIRIVDAYGKTQFKKLVFNPNSRHIEEIGLQGFSKGIYFLQVVSGESEKSVKLVIQ